MLVRLRARLILENVLSLGLCLLIGLSSYLANVEVGARWLWQNQNAYIVATLYWVLMNTTLIFICFCFYHLVSGRQTHNVSSFPMPDKRMILHPYQCTNETGDLVSVASADWNLIIIAHGLAIVGHNRCSSGGWAIVAPSPICTANIKARRGDTGNLVDKSLFLDFWWSTRQIRRWYGSWFSRPGKAITWEIHAGSSPLAGTFNSSHGVDSRDIFFRPGAQDKQPVVEWADNTRRTTTSDINEVGQELVGIFAYLRPKLVCFY
ncbi:hypothetical protein Agabi119p4_6919 [Agaricus bisporus var. burnettii]|uniref:Uncharacterized protein n=1 Tax=Agaricus bisporus var. burnettii TaxID=192524 RepID=A0A8H7KFM9_AGABI|nr:hypothetical protein Agabi119p4_6919 [Agaricus bisporus var. burnettii]